MAYTDEEIFEDEPLDQDALVASLGGQPPPQTIPPEAIAKLKALLAQAQLPTTPSSRQVLESVKPAAPFVGPRQPPEMRAATPEERVVTKLEDEGDPLNAKFVGDVFRTTPKAPPGPTAMRAATTGERIGDRLGDLLTNLKSAVVPDAAEARNTTVPEPFHVTLDPTMGSAGPEKVAGKLGKAAKASARDILEALFPKLDAYAKAKGRLKPEKVLADLLAHGEATPDMIARAEKLVAKGKALKPAEVVDVLSGVKHDRGRVIRDMRGKKLPKKPLPGAPIWVHNPATEQEALDSYLQIVEEGVPGSGFYDESGKAIYQATGENAPLAHQVGVAASATSPATSVGANTGFMLKGHGQAIAGAPVKTGRFPANMSKPIEEAYQGNIEYLGPKRDPFANQIAIGGGYATEAEKAERAVHDIWEGEAFQFIEPDGTPMRRGFSPAEHKWMDSMTDRAVAEANRRQLGGKTDWNTGSLQASAWTGAKIRAGDIKPGDAAKSFADYMKNLEMQMGREVMPGSSQGHLPELTDPAMQQQYSDRLRSFLYDAQGRDRSALQKGMLTPGSFEGPGIYKNQITPGTQARMLVGPQGSGKTRMVEPANMGLVKSHEAEYGLIGGQDATAGTMLESGALAADRDMFDLTMPTGKLAVGDPLLSDPAVQQALANDLIAVIPTEVGARVKNIKMPLNEFAAFGKQLQQTVTGAAEYGKDLGFYMERPRLEGPAQFPGAPHGEIGQGWARTIRDEIPKGKELFNQGRARENAQQWHDADVFMRDTHGMTLNDTLQEVRRAIAQHGWDGVNVVAKKYGLPLAALLLMVQQTAPQEAPPPQ